MEQQRYLLKSEPNDYSIQQLQIDHREEWDGVRNYAARKHLMAMKPGDQCFFYHSSCKVPSIVGTCLVTREAAPDPTAVDPNHKGYDEKSTPDNNRWVSVEVEFQELYNTPVTIKELRTQSTINPIIAELMLLKQSRLSVMPISDEQWQAILMLQSQKEQGQDLLEVDTTKTISKSDTATGKKSAKEASSPKKRKRATASPKTKSSSIYSDDIDEANYCSNSEQALSLEHIQAIQSDTVTKITEKDLGLKGRKHLYSIGDTLVIYYDGTKFLGKDLQRMNTLVQATKEQRQLEGGNVHLLLSGTAGICKRKTLPQLLADGAIVQRVP
ncbi:MAG: hypothetical protein SGILL_000409 [Bacillariaceae sp.]